jgi:outer membrane lipoprotein-sorting protein
MKLNRKTTWIVVAILFVASLALVAFMIQPTAQELLTQALETLEETTSGYALIEFEADVPDEQIKGTLKVWGQLDAGPNGEPAFRLELLQTTVAEAQGITIVGDGSQVWLWHPGHNAVYTGSVEELVQLMSEQMVEHELSHPYDGDYEDLALPETAEEAVIELLNYFTVERDGAEDVGDQPAYKVRLVPIPEKMPDEVRAAGGFVNVWIRVSDKAPLAVEYAEGTAGYARISATELNLTDAIDPATFTFDIPDGADVIQLVDLAQAAMAAKATLPEFETLAPTWLPQGATLLETSQVRGAIVQRYSMPGGDSFTIAQGPAELNYQPAEVGAAVTVRGVDGIMYADEEGGRSLLSWTEGELSLWIGGDLTTKQAMSIAESLQ